MYAVYLCGCTDCFLHAMFMSWEDANKWAKENSKNPEGYLIKWWRTPQDMDTSDTGWDVPYIEIN